MNSVLSSLLVIVMLLGGFHTHNQANIVSVKVRPAVDLIVYQPFCRSDGFCDISADFTIGGLLQYNKYVYWRSREAGQKWSAWQKLENDYVQLRVPWEPGKVVKGTIEVMYIGTPAGSGIISRTFSRTLPQP